MEPEMYRDMTRGDVCYHLRNEEGAELWTSFLILTIIHHFVLEGTYTTDTYSVYYTYAVFVFFF